MKFWKKKTNKHYEKKKKKNYAGYTCSPNLSPPSTFHRENFATIIPYRSYTIPAPGPAGCIRAIDARAHTHTRTHTRTHDELRMASWRCGGLPSRCDDCVAWLQLLSRRMTAAVGTQPIFMHSVACNNSFPFHRILTNERARAVSVPDAECYIRTRISHF